MKFVKIAAVLAAVAFASVDIASAASIGRSAPASPSRSVAASSSPSPARSYYAPAAPKAAPAPAPTASTPKPAPAPSTTASSGIGGTAGSMGVRKSDVTAPVAAKVDAQRAPTTTTSSSSGYNYRPAPSTAAAGGAAVAPSASYAAPAAASTGSTFWPTFGGALAGSALGNWMFGPSHSAPAGGGYAAPAGGAAPAAAAPVQYDAAGNAVAPVGAAYAAPAAAQSSYGIGSFILDILKLALLVAILVGLAWLAYKGYKMIRNYINQERGIGETQPFAPTGHFWEIQKAFAVADVEKLKTMLGPDLFDEATNGIQPIELNLSDVSHEVVRNNPREFSVHYTFTDNGSEVHQVWHYEKFGTQWLLNGIENV